MKAKPDKNFLLAVLARLSPFLAVTIPLAIWFYATYELFFTRHAGPNFSGEVSEHLVLKHDGRFKLAVMGDVRGNTEVMEDILRSVRSDHDAAVILGDLVYFPSIVRLGYINREINETAGDMPVFTVIGNHDLSKKNDSGDHFREFFGPDHYWWEFGSIVFIAINNVERDRWENELKWLGETLRKHTGAGDKIFLLMHKPPANEPGFYGMTMEASEQLHDILPEEADITMFASHFHGYMEYDFHGIPVYVTGEAGAPSKNVPPSYGYISLECTPNDCELTHVNTGYISRGDLYLEKFILIYCYYFWPFLSLLAGALAIYFYRKRKT